MSGGWLYGLAHVALCESGRSGLFFAAPFIALAYVIALPAVGFYMFAKLGIEAYQKKKSSS